MRAYFSRTSVLLWISLLTFLLLFAGRGPCAEFDVSIFLAQFHDPEKRADNLFREWRGGTYFAALRCDLTPCGANKQQKKNQEPVVSPPTSALALLYLSRWSKPEAAENFAKQYRDALHHAERRRAGRRDVSRTV